MSLCSLVYFAVYRYIPAFLRIVITVHQFVMPEWNRLNPTNAVGHSQYGLYQRASTRLSTTKNPATSLNARSMAIDLLSDP